jgi:hydrogenase expression/formation protein HypC
MCLAVPGKVTEIFEDNGVKMGRIDFSGNRQQACLSCLPEVSVGDYVIVHAGFALNILDEEEALETLDIFRQMAE